MAGTKKASQPDERRTDRFSPRRPKTAINCQTSGTWSSRMPGDQQILSLYWSPHINYTLEIYLLPMDRSSKRIVDDRRRVYLDAEADRRLRISPPPAIREAPTMRTDAWKPPRVHIIPIERRGVVIPAGGGDNEVRKGKSLFLLQF